MEVCSGGIVGMGESWLDRLDLAFELKDLGIKSVPINVLNPIRGTPLEHLKTHYQKKMLKEYLPFFVYSPDATIRMAGGRGLFDDKGINVFKSGANGAITGDMLTTQGITIAEDQRIIKQLGFRVAKP